MREKERKKEREREGGREGGRERGSERARGNEERPELRCGLPVNLSLELSIEVPWVPEERIRPLMRACIPVRLQVQIKGPTGLWQELGRTDVVQNNLNPEFKKKVELDYTFEKKQELKFIVYDWLSPPPRAPHWTPPPARPHSAAVCGRAACTCGEAARACGMLALVRGARQRSMHNTSCPCRLPPHTPPTCPPPPPPPTYSNAGTARARIWMPTTFLALAKRAWAPSLVGGAQLS